MKIGDAETPLCSRNAPSADHVAGIVLDFSLALGGRLRDLVLDDFSAEVVKIEPPSDRASISSFGWRASGRECGTES